MLEALKEQVYRANMDLVRYNLVVLTWGNVSAIDREQGLFVIKPSGVPYSELTPADMVVMDPTHLALYKAFPEIGGITHTHSSWACAWAQAGRDIPAYGTTHADFAYGDIPCARGLTEDEVNTAYEANTGLVIVEEFRRRGLDPGAFPGVLVQRHGPFTWGKSAAASVENALILEEIAKMASRTERIAGERPIGIESYLLDKHYLRKHGANAYYGQKK